MDKSESPIEGDNVVTSEEDLDIGLFRVIVGYIQDGKMLRHTKFIRDAEAVVRKLNEIQEQQIKNAVESDYRLSLLELK